MKDLLLPHKYRKIGFLLLPLAITLFIVVFLNEYEFAFLDYKLTVMGAPFDMTNDNFSDELTVLITFISLFLIAFSREKVEDEYIQRVRLQALQISVYINYGIIALSTVLVYGLDYLNVVFGNLFTILVLFILVYYYKAHMKPRLSKEL